MDKQTLKTHTFRVASKSKTHSCFQQYYNYRIATNSATCESPKLIAI